MEQYSSQDGRFFPDFCQNRMVISAMVIAQLLAMVMILAPLNDDRRWEHLGMTTLFVQWTALVSVGFLCRLRPFLKDKPLQQAVLMTYGGLLFISLILLELAFQVIHALMLYPKAIDHLDFLSRNLLISIIVMALSLRYFYLQKQGRDLARAESLARLSALQARIQPHFLFNSLNTIASLTQLDAAKAEQAVEDLAALLRQVLEKGDHPIPLDKELALIRGYINIESLRLGERLKVEWENQPRPAHLLIPPLLFQPLVENAIRHGIEPQTEGGTIRIGVTSGGGMLILTVSNPLPKEQCDESAPRGSHIALDNIRQRLHAQFGDQAGLSIDRKECCYTARLHLPLNTLSEERAA